MKYDSSLNDINYGPVTENPVPGTDVDDTDIYKTTIPGPESTIILDEKVETDTIEPITFTEYVENVRIDEINSDFLDENGNLLLDELREPNVIDYLTNTMQTRSEWESDPLAKAAMTILTKKKGPLNTIIDPINNALNFGGNVFGWIADNWYWVVLGIIGAIIGGIVLYWVGQAFIQQKTKELIK